MTDFSSTAGFDSADIIAVVGATGQQGGATVRALLAAGATVRGLTRNVNGEAAQALADAGVEVVAADLNVPESVRAAFGGATKVFAMTTPAGADGVEGEIAQGRVIADAAVAAGVSFLLFSSVGGAERSTGIPHFESKRRVEEYIGTLEIASAFVRPVFFLDNLLSTAVADGEIVVRLPYPDGHPLQMIAVDDIGRVAAAILLDPSRVDGAVEIAGDELTGTQIAAVFGRQAGLPARYEALPIAVLAGNDDMSRMFEWFAGPTAYRADFALTRSLDPEVLDTAAWLAQSAWNRA
ncbi:MAG: NmrA/HSCARG family protein [Actinomycetota bacterium]|nr:NmrA/HSCARG family protein [Actinomycetota bacterium]